MEKQKKESVVKDYTTVEGQLKMLTIIRVPWTWRDTEPDGCHYLNPENVEILEG